jgi:hypothetical protein
LSRRTYTKEFKLAATFRFTSIPGNGKQRWSEGRVAELKRKTGQEALKIDFFEGALAASASGEGGGPALSADKDAAASSPLVRGAADAAGREWKSAIYRKVQEDRRRNM